jgi:hypothetical protein
MKVRYRWAEFVGVALIVCLGAGGNPVLAQKRHPVEDKSEWSTGKYLQQHMIDVGDMPGHKIRILEVQRLYNNESRFAVSGVRVREVRALGYSDYTNGKGKAWGYAVWHLEDGNRIYSDWAGTTWSEPTSSGAIEGVFNGVTWLKGGTGKFSSVRGLITDVNHFNNDPKSGYNRSQSKGEYWFEE